MESNQFHRPQNDIYNRIVMDDEYRQRIRKHKPSSLLPLIATESAKYPTAKDARKSPYAKSTPWALADAARVSLAQGTEFQRSDATQKDLLHILAAYDSLHDPLLRGPHTSEEVMKFMLRKTYEQINWQSSQYTELARTAAIFLHSASPLADSNIGPHWDQQIFGCSLSEYIGVIQLAWASVIQNSGRFDPESVFESREGNRIASITGRDLTVETVERNFVTDIDGFREENNKSVQHMDTRLRELRRYTYNPLRGSPMLKGFGPGYLCPIPGFIWSKGTPWGVYFSGLKYFGTSFPTGLGHVFENYIGRQLNLLPNARIIPEITYRKGRETLKSVDWIAVFDDLVLLVEVKAAIPTQPIRLGDLGEIGIKSIAERIGKAFKQIDNTSEQIRARLEEFREIPPDRQTAGMVVTLEPFHLGNSPEFRSFLPEVETKTTVVGSEEVEKLACLVDVSASAVLIHNLNDPERSTWSLHSALESYSLSRNSILDTAWDSYPWAEVNREQSERRFD